MKLDNRRNEAQYAFAMLLSGTIGVVVVLSQQQALDIVLYRCVIAATILCCICWKKGHFSALYFKRKPVAATIIAGVALTLNWVLLFESFSYVPIGIATTIYHLKPFILILYGLWFLGDSVSTSKLIWILTAFFGFALVSNIGIADFGSPLSSTAYIFGALLALGAASLQPVSTIAILHSLKPFPPSLVALGQFTVGTLIIFPFFSGGGSTPSGPEWGYILILGVVHTVMMYALMYKSIPFISTSTIAILQFLYPITALALDYAVFELTPSPQQMAGIFLIILSALGVSFDWSAMGFRRV